MESDSDDPDNELEQFEMDSDSDIYESVSEGALGGERRGSSLAITTSRRPQISSLNIPHKWVLPSLLDFPVLSIFFRFFFMRFFICMWRDIQGNPFARFKS